MGERKHNKIVAISWHPGVSNFIIAGGYKRFYEIALRSNDPLIIIDRFPSLYHSLNNENIKICEYGKSYNLNFLKQINPYFYKLVDRVFTIFSISILLFKNSRKFNVIYVPYSELVELTLPAILFKYILNVPVVFCNLNVNTYFLDRPINVFLHKFADKIITISSALKDDLEKSGISPKYINGVGFDLIPYQKDKKIKIEYQAIFIGRHIAQKGIIDLIEIWNLVVNKYKKNYMLITVGDIPDYIKLVIDNLIEKYNLRSYIHLAGKVSDTVKFEMLSKSEIMVFPSNQEGWGIAPMEALSYGLPVVAYDLPVYKESIGSSEAFIKIEFKNINEFAKTVIEILENISKYKVSAKEWKPVLDWNKVAMKEWEIICQEQ